MASYLTEVKVHPEDWERIKHGRPPPGEERSAKWDSALSLTLVSTPFVPRGRAVFRYSDGTVSLETLYHE